jgi:hypothetical protein
MTRSIASLTRALIRFSTRLARSFATETAGVDFTVFRRPAGRPVCRSTDRQGANTAEQYDPSTSTWSATGSLGTARVYHTATLLHSGKVIVAGGEVNASARRRALVGTICPSLTSVVKLQSLVRLPPRYPRSISTWSSRYEAEFDYWKKSNDAPGNARSRRISATHYRAEPFTPCDDV